MLKVDCQVDRQRREQELASCFRAARRCAVLRVRYRMGWDGGGGVVVVMVGVVEESWFHRPSRGL